MNDPEVLKALREPFPPNLIQFRAGATSRDKKSALGLAYVDPRAYMERLDQLVVWSDDYEIKVLDDRIFVTCRLTVNESVVRCDVGEEPLLTKKGEINDNALTTAAAQAFKRACAKFGLGAFLYEFPNTWADYDGYKFTPNGLAKLRRMLTNQGASTPNPVQQSAPSATPAPQANESTGEIAGSTDVASTFPFDLTKLSEKDGYSAATWGYEQKVSGGGPNKAGDRVFKSKVHAVNSYNALKKKSNPQSATEMATLWMEEVDRRRIEIEEKNLDAASSS